MHIITEAIDQLEDRYAQLREVALSRICVKPSCVCKRKLRKSKLAQQRELHSLDLKIAENACKIAEIKAEFVRCVVDVVAENHFFQRRMFRVTHFIFFTS